MRLRQCLGINGKFLLAFVKDEIITATVKWKDHLNCKRAYLLKKIYDSSLGKYTPDSSTVGIIGEINQLSVVGDAVFSNVNNSYIRIGNLNDIVFPNGPLTFLGWFTLDTYGTTNNSRIFSKLDSSGYGIEFRIESSSGALKFIVISRTGGNTIRQTTNIVSLNNRAFIGLTWDGSGNASNIHIYLNGIEAPYIVTQNGGIDATISNYPLYIGNKKSFDRAIFGKYEKVAFFDKVLTLAEMNDIMNNGFS